MECFIIRAFAVSFDIFACTQASGASGLTKWSFSRKSGFWFKFSK